MIGACAAAGPATSAAAPRQPAARARRRAVRCSVSNVIRLLRKGAAGRRRGGWVDVAGQTGNAKTAPYVTWVRNAVVPVPLRRGDRCGPLFEPTGPKALCPRF